MSTEATVRLRDLLTSLDGFRNELNAAQQSDLPFVAEYAQREIRRLRGLIRRLCDLHGLPRPPAVPEIG